MEVQRKWEETLFESNKMVVSQGLTIWVMLMQMLTNHQLQLVGFRNIMNSLRTQCFHTSILTWKDLTCLMLKTIHITIILMEVELFLNIHILSMTSRICNSYSNKELNKVKTKCIMIQMDVISNFIRHTYPMEAQPQLCLKIVDTRWSPIMLEKTNF